MHHCTNTLSTIKLAAKTQALSINLFQVQCTIDVYSRCSCSPPMPPIGLPEKHSLKTYGYLASTHSIYVTYVQHNNT